MTISPISATGWRMLALCSISQHALRPKHHAPSRWPLAAVCIVVLIALAQWAPYLKVLQ